jgi:hypothetical protein
MTDRSTGTGGDDQGGDDQAVTDSLSGHDERDSAEAKADQYLDDREQNTTAPSPDPFE